MVSNFKRVLVADAHGGAQTFDFGHKARDCILRVKEDFPFIAAGTADFGRSGHLQCRTGCTYERIVAIDEEIADDLAMTVEVDRRPGIHTKRRGLAERIVGSKSDIRTGLNPGTTFVLVLFRFGLGRTDEERFVTGTFSNNQVAGTRQVSAKIICRFRSRHCQTFPTLVAGIRIRCRMDQLDRIDLVINIDRITQVNVSQIFIPEGTEIAMNRRNVNQLAIGVRCQRLLKRLFLIGIAQIKLHVVIESVVRTEDSFFTVLDDLQIADIVNEHNLGTVFVRCIDDFGTGGRQVVRGILIEGDLNLLLRISQFQIVFHQIDVRRHRFGIHTVDRERTKFERTADQGQTAYRAVHRIARLAADIERAVFVEHHFNALENRGVLFRELEDAAHEFHRAGEVLLVRIFVRVLTGIEIEVIVSIVQRHAQRAVAHQQILEDVNVAFHAFTVMIVACGSFVTAARNFNRRIFIKDNRSAHAE